MPISITEGVYMFDIEADSLLDGITKIHCLSVGKILKSGELKIQTTTDYGEMKSFFLNGNITKVGHNIIRYDLPAIDKVLGITSDTESIADTLPLSWMLFTRIRKHGLEEWGEHFGVPKPVVESFSGLEGDKLDIMKYFEDIYIK